MTSHTCRIRRWVSTGENIFETDFEESKAVASTTGTTEKIQDAPVGKTATISQHTAETPSESSTSDESLVDLNSEPKNVDLLFGCEGDILIPSSDQIHCTFLKCRSIWRTYVTCANLLPSGCVPIGSLDPYILLQKIPPLPQDVPRKQSITGEAIWHVACPELLKSQVDSEYNEEDWDPEFVHGNKKIFPLSILKPTECRISSRSDFRLNNGRPNGIAILTSLWSYIFSVRLLELQKRQIRYSLKRLSPVLIKDVESQPRDIVIYLGCASRKLTRWLCAVLASGLGWQVTGPLPPWTTHYEENTRFIIATDTPFSFLAHERPPSSCEAADLLTELCTLFDFGSSLTDHEKSFETLQQPTAAFLAALVLPFYNKMGLQPQLPMPSMTTVHRGHATPPGYIRDYIDDLPYYMTLSIHPPSVGSIIWSIFWEPGLDCNLVSAWFGSILEVVRPIVEAGNLEVLAKIFMARRQSPALLWFGIFVLGGSLSWPDVDVAAWTGSKQSFLDEDALGSYEDIFAQVPRSDLLRHRFNFRLNDFDMPRFGWQPFGHVIKHEIEPELWPRLETRCSRKYKHWIWWLPAKDKNGVRLVPEVIVPDIQRGFRRDKVKHTKSIPGQVELDSTIAEIPGGFDCKVMLGPSRDATFHIMSYGSKDAAGDRSLEAMVIPRIREHSWMLDSRGI